MVSLIITILTVHFVLLQMTTLHSLDCLSTLLSRYVKSNKDVLTGSYLNLAIYCRFGERTGFHPSSSQVLDHCLQDKILQDLPSPSNPVNKHRGLFPTTSYLIFFIPFFTNPHTFQSVYIFSIQCILCTKHSPKCYRNTTSLGGMLSTTLVLFSLYYRPRIRKSDTYWPLVVR